KQYCKLHAAAACIYMWRYNRSVSGQQILGDFFAEGKWLVLCVHRLLDACGVAPNPVSLDDYETVYQRLVQLHREDKMFSIVPFQLANTTTQSESHATTPELQLL
ncbi:MAG: acyl-CoA dehydrogenase, partial [Cyanobacteria bacterium P01_A01_bin.105]